MRRKYILTSLLFCCTAAFALLLAGCGDKIGDTSAKELTGSTKKMIFRVDAIACGKCGTCYDACPEQAIQEMTLDGEVFYMVDPDLCVDCGECVNVCKFGGMRRVPYTGEE